MAECDPEYEWVLCRSWFRQLVTIVYLQSWLNINVRIGLRQRKICNNKMLVREACTYPSICLYSV